VSPILKKEEIITRIYDFENLDTKDIITYETSDGIKKNIYVSIFTDGCTKYIRFSDISLSRRVETGEDENKG
jgi:hypothetical protein